MDVVRVEALNEVHVRVRCDPSVGQEIADAFTFEVPGARFAPKFQAGLWDGKLALFSIYQGIFYKGLITELYKFCERQGYRLSLGPGIAPAGIVFEGRDEELREFASAITSDEYEDREYQISAFVEAVKMDRAVFLSSTSSGKTLMIYRLMAFYAGGEKKKTLMLTTRKNLVAQAVKDFTKYATDDVKAAYRFTKVDEDTDRKEAVENGDMVVCTWQSAMHADARWFENFSCIIADEVHSWDSKAFVKIAEKCKKIKFRFGFTGTLDGSRVNRMVLTGLFGPVVTVSTNRERIEAGDVAKPKITMIRLNYPTEDRKLCARYRTNEKGKPAPMTYQDELEHIISHVGRRRAVVELCASLKGNTLVLFNRNEKYGLPLFQAIEKKAQGRQCRLIYGATETEDRLAVMDLMEANDDVIAQASIGTFSEGMSVDNIRNVIFTWPMKNKVRLLQSIGRGIRKMEGKEFCRFFDFVDDMKWKRRANHLWKHALVRCSHYDEQGFEYTWREIEL